jgi:transposase InsO family protein
MLRSKSLLWSQFVEGAEKPVIRTDNVLQFVSYKFSECCEEIGIEHERIPVKTPNKFYNLHFGENLTNIQIKV